MYVRCLHLTGAGITAQNVPWILHACSPYGNNVLHWTPFSALGTKDYMYMKTPPFEHRSHSYKAAVGRNCNTSSHSITLLRARERHKFWMQIEARNLELMKYAGFVSLVRFKWQMWSTVRGFTLMKQQKGTNKRANLKASQNWMLTFIHSKWHSQPAIQVSD